MGSRPMTQAPQDAATVDPPRDQKTWDMQFTHLPIYSPDFFSYSFDPPQSIEFDLRCIPAQRMSKVECVDAELNQRSQCSHRLASLGIKCKMYTTNSLE